jgi:hypothetical protein
MAGIEGQTNLQPPFRSMMVIVGFFNFPATQRPQFGLKYGNTEEVDW